MRGEHQQPRGGRDQEARERPGHGERDQRVERNARPESEQAQIDDRDRAEQQRDASDMDGLGGRIRVERLAHEAADAAGLDRVKRARHARTQRSSTVLPATMMRSARISSGLLRFA